MNHAFIREGLITRNELMDAFDHLIEKWHSDPNTKGSLHSFLGLTLREYADLISPNYWPTTMNQRRVRHLPHHNYDF